MDNKILVVVSDIDLFECCVLSLNGNKNGNRWANKLEKFKIMGK